VVGPNCQGVNYPYHGVCASRGPLITRRGEIAIVSAKRTVGAATDRLGVRRSVSVLRLRQHGNRSDVDEAEPDRFLREDPHTKVIALYIEG